MQTTQQSTWQQAARKRWRTAGIVGDGPFAMHAACCLNGMVFLFWFQAEAVQAANAPCGHAFCKRLHVAYQLQPRQQSQQQYQPAHACGYGKD
jgi:hypothetical protein